MIETARELRGDDTSVQVWTQWARFYHELAAAVAILAFAWLFAQHWKLGETFPYPIAASLIILSLAVGAGIARTVAGRLERVGNSSAVLALLRIADTLETEDDYADPAQRWANGLTLIVMNLQIAVTGLAGVALVFQFNLNSPTSGQPLDEVNAWPGVAAIVLLEGIYLAWLAEGRAVAEELMLVSRRWIRTRGATASLGRLHPMT